MDFPTGKHLSSRKTEFGLGKLNRYSNRTRCDVFHTLGSLITTIGLSLVTEVWTVSILFTFFKHGSSSEWNPSAIAKLRLCLWLVDTVDWAVKHGCVPTTVLKGSNRHYRTLVGRNHSRQEVYGVNSVTFILLIRLFQLSQFIANYVLISTTKYFATKTVVCDATIICVVKCALTVLLWRISLRMYLINKFIQSFHLQNKTSYSRFCRTCKFVN